MMSDGYVDWLGHRPRGQVPGPHGTADDPDGVHRRLEQAGGRRRHQGPLSEIYPPEVLDGPDQEPRHHQALGLPAGPGRAASAPLLGELPVPKALAADARRRS